MNCPICNTLCSQIHVTVKNYPILKCHHCTHGFLSTNDMPEYDESYFESHYRIPDPNSKAFRKIIKEQTHRVKKVKSIRKKGNLLDVGCGLGHFLYAAKLSGYRVSGFDFTKQNEDYITNTLKIELITSKSKAIQNGRYDIVTSWHSLEHAVDPKAYLQFVDKILDNKGVLVIEVPTHDCIDAFKMEQSWPNWDPPFHLQHFTLASLHFLLKRCGFKVVHEYTYNSDHIRNTLKKSPFFMFSRPISKLFRGNSVACICEKIEIL